MRTLHFRSSTGDVYLLPEAHIVNNHLEVTASLFRHPSYIVKMSEEIDDTTQKRVSSDNEQGAASYSSTAPIGRENLSDQVPPHEFYEGLHRWDPAVTWTPEEEKKLVRKTDFMLLSWLCLMVRSLPSRHST